MSINRRVLVAAVLFVLAPALVTPQAPPSLSLARVMYNTRKATSPPQGELKAQIDALDKEIAEAMRLGRRGEARRLLAKGMTLLAGQAWSEQLDYSTSLVLRSDRVLVDSTKPYVVRLEQLYSPSIALERSLSAQVFLRKGSEAAKDFGVFDGVSRDLRDAPFSFELQFGDVPDGTYQLTAAVRDGPRVLGSATMTVAVRKGLDETLARLEAEAARASDAFRADILAPADLAGAAQHHGDVGARRALMARGDESIRDSLRRSLSAPDDVKCTGAWTPPSLRTHRTRPRGLGKPHRTRFPTASTRTVIERALHTKFLTLPNRHTHRPPFPPL